MNGYQMTLRQLERAQALVDELVRRSTGDNRDAAMQLRDLLTPHRLAEILMSIPGETHKERIKRIGISHQGYYNLLNGVSKPNSRTAARLAQLTGLTADAIQRAGP